jgi:hypothetical protein
MSMIGCVFWLAQACSDPASTARDAALAAADRADRAGAAPTAVIDHSAWRSYAASDDPLPAHQPPSIECGVAGFYPERLGLEIDTGRCNYVLAEHPAQVAIAKGAELRFVVSHYDLVAPEPATAHVALSFGGDLQWQTTIDIPHAAQVIDTRLRASRALRDGEPIRLHLHNHGQNTWQVTTLELTGR